MSIPFQLNTKQSERTIYRQTRPRIEIPDIPVKELLDYLDKQEYGDGLLFAHAFTGKVCYDFSRQTWFLWYQHYWREDESGYIKTIVSGYLGSIYLKANIPLNNQRAEKARKLDILIMKSDKTREEMREEEDLKAEIKTLDTTMEAFTNRAKNLRRSKYNKSVLYYAMSEPSIAVSGSTWDSDPYLLGCINGVVNLRTGAFRDGQPEDYIRSACPTPWVGLNAPCPRFERFLTEIFDVLPEEQLGTIYPNWQNMTQNEKESAISEQRPLLISFIHRLLGYSIAGVSSEAIFPILYGEEGRNGKDTLFKRLRKILGLSIADGISNDVLLTKTDRSAGAATPHICDLQGKRIVWASETKQGDVFNVSQIKLLTGDGAVSARPLFGKQYTFDPSHTLYLMTNNKPHANAKDKAFWTRAALVEFSTRFVDDPTEPNERKKDDTLNDQLDQEHSGILAWLIRGYLEYQRIGLQRPALVLASTESYRQSEDTIGDFIDDCCYTHPLYQVSAKKLYEQYAVWSKDNGLKPMSNNLFGAEIATRYKKMHSNQGNIYTGIGLADDNEPPTTGEGISEGITTSEGTSEGSLHNAKPASQANSVSSINSANEGSEGTSGKVSHEDQKNAVIGDFPESAFTAFTEHPILSIVKPTDKPSHNGSEGSNAPSLMPSQPSLVTEEDKHTLTIVRAVLESRGLLKKAQGHTKFNNGEFLRNLEQILIKTPNPTSERVEWARTTMQRILDSGRTYAE